MRRVDVDAANHAPGAELHDAPVAREVESGIARQDITTTARFPSVHPLAAIGVFPLAPDRRRLENQAILRREELVVGRHHHGAKLFRREMLDTVAPLLLIKRYAFDLEVLAVGAEFGFDRIEEVPIQLHYRFTGSGIGSAAVKRMFVDTLAIAYRIHIVHWYVRRFASLQRERTGDGEVAGDWRRRASDGALAKVSGSDRALG